MDGAMTIEIDRLRVLRSGRLLAHVPNVQVHAGEFVALIGPNGAGKSSVVRALAGEWAAQGTVHLFGRCLSRWPRHELARRMAVMPQQSQLNFDFTVSEVVKMGRLPHRGEAAHRTRTAVEASMNALALEPLALRRFTTLSGGERQRVQFARVMAQLWGVEEPTLLLLDEPTSALDLAQQQAVLDQAWQLSRVGTTVLAVMHDLNMVSRYAQRVLVMQQAEQVFDGSPASFMREQDIQTVFGVDARVEMARSDQRPVVLIGPASVDGSLKATRLLP
jgi:iron complex transport system ATP-binding protein